MAKMKKTNNNTTTETMNERQTRETTQADNVVKGQEAPTSRRDLRNDTAIEDMQTKINKEVEESQGAKGSTASKTPGPKA